MLGPTHPERSFFLMPSLSLLEYPHSRQQHGLPHPLEDLTVSTTSQNLAETVSGQNRRHNELWMYGPSTGGFEEMRTRSGSTLL